MNRRAFLRALGMGIAISRMLDLAPIEPVMSAAQLADVNAAFKLVYLDAIAEMVNADSPLLRYFR